MIDVVLVVVILALIGYISFKEWLSAKERNKYLNAIIAKNSQELANLELVDKTEIKSTPLNDPEFIPVDQASDNMFMKAIQNEIGMEDE
jgi:Tfp pilus assembly protein PilE